MPFIFHFAPFWSSFTGSTFSSSRPLPMWVWWICFATIMWLHFLTLKSWSLNLPIAGPGSVLCLNTTSNYLGDTLRCAHSLSRCWTLPSHDFPNVVRFVDEDWHGYMQLWKCNARWREHKTSLEQKERILWNRQTGWASVMSVMFLWLAYYILGDWLLIPVQA